MSISETSLWDSRFWLAPEATLEIRIAPLVTSEKFVSKVLRSFRWVLRSLAGGPRNWRPLYFLNFWELWCRLLRRLVPDFWEVRRFFWELWCRLLRSFRLGGTSAAPERSTTSGTFDACGVAITHFESPCGISEILCCTFEIPCGAFDALLVDLKCSFGVHLWFHKAVFNDFGF